MKSNETVIIWHVLLCIRAILLTITRNAAPVQYTKACKQMMTCVEVKRCNERTLSEKVSTDLTKRHSTLMKSFLQNKQDFYCELNISEQLPPCEEAWQYNKIPFSYWGIIVPAHLPDFSIQKIYDWYESNTFKACEAIWANDLLHRYKKL